MRKMMMIFLVFLAAGVVFAEMEGEHIFKARLNEVQVMPDSSCYPAGTHVILRVYASGGKETGIHGRDGDLWRARCRVALDWIKKYQLVLDDTKIIYVHGYAGDRGVTISRDEEYYKTQEFRQKTQKSISQIREKNQEQDRRLNGHDEQINVLKKDVDLLKQEILGNQMDFHRLQLGLGAVATRYDAANWVAVPSAKLVFNLSQSFGLQAEGGVFPAADYQQESTWDGALNAAFFYQPLSFIKIVAGYSHASNFYESDFAAARSEDDGWLAGLEFNMALSENISAYAGANVCQSDYSGKSFSVGLTYGFWK